MSLLSIASGLASGAGKLSGLWAGAKAVGSAVLSKAWPLAKKVAPVIGTMAASEYVGHKMADIGSSAGAQVEYVYGRPRRRGITARDFRITRRTMTKIIKMYNKLPKRPAHRTFAPSRGRGRGIDIVNVD